MKIVKFKGFSEELGTWLYGDLVTGLNDRIYIRYFVTNGPTSEAVSTAVSKDSISQYIGLNDKNNNEIYSKDRLKFTPLPNSGFEHSKPGKIMEDKNVNSLIIQLVEFEFLGVMYDVFFQKGDNLLTEKEFYEYEEETLASLKSDAELRDLENLYYQRGVDMHFLRYLNNKKGLEIIL